MPYTAQHILYGPSGLPEDRFVNTFHFGDPDPGTWGDEDVADAILVGLERFFTETNTGGQIQSFLAQFLDPDVDIKVYREGDPEPREPIVRTYTQARPASDALPTEVAAVLSFYANRNIPRQRGRIFLGPLNTSVGAVVVAEGNITRPSGAFRGALAEAAAKLAVAVDPLGPPGLRWCTRSAGPYADGSGAGVVTFAGITNGWVDNAWDTQRRRGLDATARTEWVR